MLRYLQIVLQRAGFNVTTAADGAQGLQKALSTAFNIIVADFTMPQINGYELFRHLRHSLPECPKLILLSGSEFDETLTQSRVADLYLLKDTHLSENLISAAESLTA